MAGGYTTHSWRKLDAKYYVRIRNIGYVFTIAVWRVEKVHPAFGYAVGLSRDARVYFVRSFIAIPYTSDAI